MNASLGNKIAVCLLVYNHADLIESTLASILDQTLSGADIIVSDDCSTDGTWERIQIVAAREDRIRVIRTERNLGMAGNANFAIGHTDRTYVALLHHDDRYRPDLLEKWAGVLERNVDVAFVFNAYQTYEPLRVYAESITGERMAGTEFLERFLFARWGCPVRGTAMIRRQYWAKVGGMRTQYDLLADIDLWMRLAMVGNVGYVAEPLIEVRQKRPDDYPDLYRHDRWSWQRQRHLYQVHAANHLAYYDLRELRGRVRWWVFRLRLTLETAKWLAYAVIRGRDDMIEKSLDGGTPYDLWPLRVFRRALIAWNARRCGNAR